MAETWSVLEESQELYFCRMTKLSVNINKIATLRNARGGNNPDVVKAFHYINSNWKSRPLWKNNPYFKNIDARIHVDKTLAAKWKEEITKEKYLNASDSLFKYLWTPK